MLELEIFKHYKFPDLEELKKNGKGSYSETIQEKDGYITTETTYESEDGTMKYYKTDIRPKTNKKGEV